MSLPVIIMAAGRGTRMKELTASQPKHLIEVAGRPFLAYVLDNLISAGLTDLYIVVGYCAPATYDFIKQYPHSVNIKIINQFERLGEEKYGTLMPFFALQPELLGRDVLVVYSDNLFSVPDLQNMQSKKNDSATGGFLSEHPERYGVLVPKADGTLDYIIEKPANPTSNLVNCGLYRLGKKIWDVVPNVQISKRGEYELTDAVNLLAKEEAVAIVQLKDYWLDLGRPEDVKEIEFLLKNRNII